MKYLLYFFTILIISFKTWYSLNSMNSFHYEGFIDFVIYKKGYEVLIILPILFIISYLIETVLLPLYINYFVKSIAIRNSKIVNKFDNIKAKLNDSNNEYDKAIEYINQNSETRNDFYANACFLPIMLTLLFLSVWWSIFVLIPIVFIWLLFMLYIPILKSITSI